jgi:sec-independent protein translocase protein TatA
MLGGIGVQEIVIILIVGLLVFGATRLPKIARSLGQGIKEFKKTVKGLDEDEDEARENVRYVQPPGQGYYPPQGGPQGGYPPAGGNPPQQPQGPDQPGTAGQGGTQP